MSINTFVSNIKFDLDSFFNNKNKKSKTSKTSESIPKPQTPDVPPPPSISVKAPANKTLLEPDKKINRPPTPSWPIGKYHRRESRPRYKNTSERQLIGIELHGMPKHGWIHGCIFCMNPTARFESIEELDVIICGKCARFPLKSKQRQILSLT